jgi:hypothetical protein
MNIYTGETGLELAHASRRDDLRRAREHRQRAELRLTVRHDTRSHHRPWWWGLARARAS